MTNPWHIKRLVGLGTLTRIIFHIQMIFFVWRAFYKIYLCNICRFNNQKWIKGSNQNISKQESMYLWALSIRKVFMNRGCGNFVVDSARSCPKWSDLTFLLSWTICFAQCKLCWTWRIIRVRAVPKMTDRLSSFLSNCRWCLLICTRKRIKGPCMIFSQIILKEFTNVCSLL